MENASKALIIAGAILLSILIIALGIYVFNMAKGATNTDSLDEMEVSQFNQLFTNYDGRAMGTNVTALLDKLVTGATKNAGADDRLPDLLYIDTRAKGALAIKDIGSGKEATAYKSDKDLDAKIIGAGFDPKKVTFQIASYSGNENVSGFSAFRSKISPRHYYQVGHINSDTTGLVEYMIVQY